MILSRIGCPADIKKLTNEEMRALAAEIRQEIITTVTRNGGHLASNLGAVELTMALHRVLDCPQDKIIFDVGHQCYTHKLLTGRYRDFATLRQTDGLCGFPRRAESDYDAFDAGHASTAISAALGMARARDMLGQKYRIAAVVGDGAMTGGMCYEALNDAGGGEVPLMVILNDNGMSISRNVGALSGQLTRLRLSRGWLGMKKAVSVGLLKLPGAGRSLYKAFQRMKNELRNVLVKEKFFTSLGFRYFGPIDGHDLEGLERALLSIRDIKGPVLLHVVTTKGRGYTRAEEHPEAFHGVVPQVIEQAGDRTKQAPSLGAEAGAYLNRLAEKDIRICAICAAMGDGTGFSSFAQAHGGRFFDVGIAEEHAVTLAAGMAAGGMRPFVAIYETFLQRGFDQMMEDVCLQKLPVCFLMDRAGIGGEDGATHHGLYGLAMLKAMPNLTVLSPCNAGELRQMIDWALAQPGPVAIRYPRHGARRIAQDIPFHIGHWECVKEGRDGAILCCSSLLDEAICAAEGLQANGLNLAIYNASSLAPLDTQLLQTWAEKKLPFFTVEEHDKTDGLGCAVAAYCAAEGLCSPRAMLGLPHDFVPHGRRESLLKRYGLTGEQIAVSIEEAMKK